ncbi:hypothetical protein LIA77_06440 [Sarocladium implicatum]|nr:hypothetical protein LIA77_06440 [Sarocladium implicatum]
MRGRESHVVCQDGRLKWVDRGTYLEPATTNTRSEVRASPPFPQSRPPPVSIFSSPRTIDIPILSVPAHHWRYQTHRCVVVFRANVRSGSSFYPWWPLQDGETPPAVRSKGSFWCEKASHPPPSYRVSRQGGLFWREPRRSLRQLRPRQRFVSSDNGDDGSTPTTRSALTTPARARKPLSPSTRWLSLQSSSRMASRRMPTVDWTTLRCLGSGNAKTATRQTRRWTASRTPRSTRRFHGHLATRSVDINEPILKRPLPDAHSDDEPQAKRQKSVEPSASTIEEKVSSDAYAHIEDMAADLLAVIKAALSELEVNKSEDTDAKSKEKTATQIRHFKEQAMDLFYREKMYPQTASLANREDDANGANGDVVLSLVGLAPSEKRLFSSLPRDKGADVTEQALPHGMAFTRIMPGSSMPQEKAQTLGELFASPRTLPTLQAPKPPKTHIKGNNLELYYPELTDKSSYRANSYFSQKLSTGHFLDYTTATAVASAKSKQRERAQSLAGKKPSANDFAPCKDDSSALVSAGTVGRIWWQRAGQRNFQRMVEVEYYEDTKVQEKEDKSIEIDEDAIQSSIDNWDDSMVDPTLADIMGTKSSDHDKEADEILEEVSDLIETLASYQRIRNLNLPNSQNRQTSDPVNGDMLANAGPEPSEEEQETYEVLKAQLALIIKTLPPYAVAKLNGDQLDDLLISTKVQIQSDNFKGTMEEDEAGVQARLRSQQQQQQQQHHQYSQTQARPPTAQRTPSSSGMSYAKPYQAPNQYGTPTRTPSQNQQFYRHGSYGGGYQQPQGMPPSAQQHRPQYQNQYSRPPNGFPSQYATQLAKTQTPYGHQNMAHPGTQQRVHYPHQAPQQGTPGQPPRYNNYPQGYPQQAPATPGQGAYPPQQGGYTNGAAGPPRTMSPQMNRQSFSTSPHQTQRYGVPGQQQQQPQQSMQSQMGRFPATQGLPQQQQGGPMNMAGYPTTIPEAQQQRILEQAKARVAAQERTAMFGDKISTASPSPATGGMDVNRLAAARAGLASLQKPQSPNPQQQQQQRSGSVGSGSGATGSPVVPPGRVTPVPLPTMPGAPPPPRKDSA